MNRYESYKDVDLPWLKKIPSHWEVSKYKKFFKSGMGQTILKSELINQGIPVYSATESDKIFGYLKNSSLILYENDLIIPARGNSIGFVKVIKEEKATCTQTTIYSKSINTINSSYIRYFYLSFKNYFFQFNDTAIPQITVAQVNNNDILLPPLQEQTQIANYLDWKINEIDKLIAKEKEKIRELEKLKDYKISEMIWNNKNFKLERIKNLFTLRNERNVEDKEADLISLYTKLGVVRNEEVEYKTGNKNTTVDGYKKVYVNDIVVNIMLCWMGAIGVSNYSGVTSPAYDIYKPNLKKVNPHFFHYLFRTEEFKDILYKNGKGIVLMKWRVYSDKFRNISVPLFSLKEQNNILKKIEILQDEIDKFNKKTELIIEEFQKLKQSLISEVVTGGIDVRDVVIPEYEKFNLENDVKLDEEVE